MTLPRVETPTYELTLPSQELKVKYRPFLVKEEKILLMAMETQKEVEIYEATKQIVDACTFNKLEVENLPTFDLEYIFLNIRAKSVGEIAKLKVLCPDDNETYASVEVDLSKVEVQVDENHNNEVQINDKVKILMKYPTIDSFDPQTDATQLKTSQLFDIIGHSIYQIYEGETVHNAKDYTKQELQSFIESLTSEHFAKIQTFFNTMPRLAHDIEVENPKTKVKSKVTLQGLASFFVSPSHMTT